MDPITLRNRLLVATGMWKEATGEPLPRLAPGDPAEQIQSFELLLVNRLWETATPDTAREVADRTWGLVHRLLLEQRGDERVEVLATLAHQIADLGVGCLDYAADLVVDQSLCCLGGLRHSRQERPVAVLRDHGDRPDRAAHPPAAHHA